MKIIKKLLSFILSAQMVFTLSAAAFAEKWQYYANKPEPGTYGSYAGPEQGSTEAQGISLMSLLPMGPVTYTDVFIDHGNTTPDGLDDNSFYVREAFPRTLTLGTSGEYEKLLFSFDDENYRPVDMDDIISLDSNNSYNWGSYKSYKTVLSDRIYFLAGYNADDQLDNSNTQKYIVTVYLNSTITNFLNGIECKLYDESDIPIKTYLNSVSYGYDYFGSSRSLFHMSSSVLPDSLKDNDCAKLKLELPAGYSSANTHIYSGIITDESELSSAKDVTDDILKNGYLLSNSRYDYFTFVLNASNGSKKLIPVNYYIGNAESYVYVNLQTDYAHKYKNSKVTFNNSSYYDYIDVYEADSFSDLNISLNGYYRYFSESADSYFDDISKITVSCLGYYKTLDDIKRANITDIKDQLFSDRYFLDLSQFESITGTLEDGTAIQVKEINVTTVDEEGYIYHNSVYVGITPERTDESEISDSTYFYIRSPKMTLPNGFGSASSYDSYIVSSSDDSYYNNGYQTVFMLDNQDPVADGTVIYPSFYSGAGVKMFTDAGVQTSGYSPLTFKSGKAVQYSASAENGRNLKNYWVTFVTQQKGPKLFVNAANTGKSAKREVFLNNTYDFHHDIFFANIGDEELTAINVSLSPDTTGVKLDPYWTVVDSSIKKLNPFTTTSSYSIDNIAKIRLIPENEDAFAPISGKLTISSANGGSVDIALTGIAGVPRIVTDQLYDGVKYVPYSYVIMTNSMYGTDAMEFTIIDGQLPNGIELKPNGELYGVPTEVGQFTFTVMVKYKGNAELGSMDSSDFRTYTLTVKDNSDSNVDAVNEDAQGYSLENRVSKNITVYYNGLGANDVPVIDRIELDSDLFWSEGSYSTEFINFYIDGYELKEGVDYYAEEGSTKITVKAQTFGHTSLSAKDIPHTLAGEFRTNNKTDQLRRSAQNVYINYVPVNGNNNNNGGNQGGSGGSGNNGGNSGNSAGGTIAPTVSTDKTVSAVSASFTVVDAEGDPISGIMLELHSTPQYAKTDSNGVAKFDTVEFGKHTIYIKNLKTGKKVSGSFTLESGSEAQIKDNVITAKNSDPVSAIIRYDGKSIELLSATVDNIESGAGMVTSENVSVHSYGYAAVITISALAAVCASFGLFRRKKHSSDKN